MSAPSFSQPELPPALAKSIAALRRLANYVLPPALDRRLLELGERKEFLTAEEHEELLAWVKFTQERSIEKAQAQVALRRLAELYPDAVAGP